MRHSNQNNRVPTSNYLRLSARYLPAFRVPGYFVVVNVDSQIKREGIPMFILKNNHDVC